MAPVDAEDGLYSDGKPVSSSQHSHLFSIPSAGRDEASSFSNVSSDGPQTVPVEVEVTVDKGHIEEDQATVGAVLRLSPGLPALLPDSSGETTKNSQPPSFFPQQGELKVLQCVDIPSQPKSGKDTSSPTNESFPNGTKNLGHSKTMARNS